MDISKYRIDKRILAILIIFIVFFPQGNSYYFDGLPIKTEIESKPYSDEKISLIFKEKGVNVARRTVAKYREMLNIPSSAERKRLMRLNKVINI